jgi:hypothetical protein
VIKLFLQNYAPSFGVIEAIVILLKAPHNSRSSSLRGGDTVAVVYQQLQIQKVYMYVSDNISSQ